MSTTEVSRRPVRRLMAAAAVLLAVVGAVVVPGATAGYADAAGRGGDFVPHNAPSAVLDTRSGIGGVTGKRGPASVTTFQVLGVGGIPSTGVRAVLVRVGSAQPTAATHLAVYPDGTTRGDLIALNVRTDEALSNVAIVQVGANGRLAVYNNAGSTHIIVDVQGYFTTATGSTWGGLVPVTQTRVVDTRTGIGTTTGTIAAGGSRTVNLATAGIPVGASAAFVTITVPNPSGNGWLAAGPAGAPAPGVGLHVYKGGTNTASGTAIRLAADGRVTVTNKGGVAAHVVIDILAYFTPTARAGAGFRPVTDRIYDAQVAAGATVDVQVAGIHGMPLRGVAGVAVDLYANGSATGYLRAWTPTSPEPAGASQTYHEASQGRRSLAIVKPGPDGRIRIRNISSAAVRLVVELQGWFADPLPTVPVASWSPVSVLQATPGTLDYAYVDNLGRMVTGHQSQVDNMLSVQWSIISGNEAFTGPTELRASPDGRIQLGTQNVDGDVWTTSQTAAEAATWNAWSDLGGSMAAPPAIGRLPSGVMVLFAVDVDGKLWAYAQTGSLPHWLGLGDQDLTGTPTAVPVRDGLQVVARDTTGAVKTMLYYADGSASAWTSLGGLGIGRPAAVLYPGYRLRVLARAADGSIVTKLQEADGTFPVAWAPVGGFVAAGAPAAILDPVLGRTAVLARGADDLIYASWETGVGTGVFGAWAPAVVGAEPEPSATDPVVAPVTNVNGSTWVFVFRNRNDLVRPYYREFSSSPAAATAPAEDGPAAGHPAGVTFTGGVLPAPPR